MSVAARDKRMSASEFAAALRRLAGDEVPPRFVVAVSGGSDSVALLRLAAEAFPGRIAAATVDHGLRSASAEEAREVGRWCQRLDVPHTVLVWTGAKPTSGLQAAARAARYRLLAEHCRALGRGAGAAPLLVAHTLDDQIETFLLRLAHGSDLEGLGGMRERIVLAGAPPVLVLRPLLGVGRARLRAYLQGIGQGFIDDPSNQDPRFERVRLRRLLNAGEHSSFQDEMARSAAMFSRVRTQLDRLTDRLVPLASTPKGKGAVLLSQGALAALPRPAASRILKRLLKEIGARPYPPRSEALARLLDRLIDPAFKGATLAGCRLGPARLGEVLVRPEPARRHGRPKNIAHVRHEARLATDS